MKFDLGKTRIQQCIFDLDGLLLDTESLYTQATQELLNVYANGAKYTREVKNKIMGEIFERCAHIVIDEYNMKLSVEEYINEFETISRKLIMDCNFMPFAEDFVLYVKSLGMPMGIATGSGMESYKIKSHKHREFFENFDFVITGDDVHAGKPDPEIFIKSLGMFADPDPKKTLVFEDSANGVISACRAGLPCVWVVDERNTPPDLKLPENLVENSNILKLTSLSQFDRSILSS